MPLAALKGFLLQRALEWMRLCKWRQRFQPFLVGWRTRNAKPQASGSGSFQLRNPSLIVFAALFETAGLKLMQNLPLRFFDRWG